MGPLAGSDFRSEGRVPDRRRKGAERRRERERETDKEKRDKDGEKEQRKTKRHTHTETKRETKTETEGERSCQSTPSGRHVPTVDTKGRTKDRREETGQEVRGEGLGPTDTSWSTDSSGPPVELTVEERGSVVGPESVFVGARSILFLVVLHFGGRVVYPPTDRLLGHPSGGPVRPAHPPPTGPLLVGGERTSAIRDRRGDTPRNL